MNKNDDDLNPQEEDKQDVKVDDLPVTESDTDRIKGGIGTDGGLWRGVS